ncbi:MAG: PEP-CTERM sorting domain-containing protein [Luteolibacter sp.]
MENAFMNNFVKKCSWLILIGLLFMGISSESKAATTAYVVYVNVESSGATAITDSDGDALAVGSLIEIGYYDSTSTWVSVSFSSTFAVGDGDEDAGYFNGLLYSENSADLTTLAALLSSGQQLTVRIYNGTTVATSTYYAEATSTGWVVTEDAILGYSLVIDLQGDNVVWTSDAYQATIAVPEPATALLGASGLLALLARRRRK